MVAIRLYQPEEVVLNYFKTWGFESPDVLSHMTSSFLDEHKNTLSMDEILVQLNERAFEVSGRVLGATSLSKEQQIAYFKMIFLAEGLAKKVHIFTSFSSVEATALKKIYAEHIFQTSPSLSRSVMIPQKIKVYKPLLPLKKALLDLVRKVKKYVYK